MSELQLPRSWWALDPINHADAHTVWHFTSVNTCAGFPEAMALTVAREELLAYAMWQQERLALAERRLSVFVDHAHPDFRVAMDWLIPYMRERYSNVFGFVADEAVADGVIRYCGYPMVVVGATFVEAKAKT